MCVNGFARGAQNTRRMIEMAAKVDKEKCVGCETCVGNCPVTAIKMEDGKAVVKESDCIECGACVGECPVEAIALQ